MEKEKLYEKLIILNPLLRNKSKQEVLDLINTILENNYYWSENDKCFRNDEINFKVRTQGLDIFTPERFLYAHKEWSKTDADYRSKDKQGQLAEQLYSLFTRLTIKLMDPWILKIKQESQFTKFLDEISLLFVWLTISLAKIIFNNGFADRCQKEFYNILYERNLKNKFLSFKKFMDYVKRINAKYESVAELKVNFLGKVRLKERSLRSLFDIIEKNLNWDENMRYEMIRGGLVADIYEFMVIMEKSIKQIRFHE